MLVDWFTVAAQIVNFLILIGLLKWLLYDRIIRAMDERKERIESQFRQAQEQQDQAEEEARKHRRKQEQLQQQREEILQQARDRARQQRQELTAQARRDVQEQRSNWVDSLKTQQSSFLDGLRRQASRHICGIARQVLTDLAQRDLQKQVVAVFRDKLRNLETSETEEISEALSDRQELTLRSAWSLDEEDRHSLLEVVRDQLELENVQEETEEGLICGLELQADGWALRWNVDEYLDELTERIDQEIEQQIRGGKGKQKEADPEASDNAAQDEKHGEEASQ